MGETSEMPLPPAELPASDPGMAAPPRSGPWAGDPLERATARRIVAGVSWTMLSRMAALLAALVGQIFIARWLGPDRNGLLQGTTTFLAAAMLIADLGVNTAVSRLLARAYYTDRRAVPRILSLGFALKLALTLPVGLSLFFTATAVARWLGEDASLVPVLAWTGLQLVLDNVATFAFRGLQGLHSPGRLAVGQAVSGLSSPVLAATLVGMGFGPEGAVMGRAAGAGLAAVYALAALLALARAVRLLGAASPRPEPLSGGEGATGRTPAGGELPADAAGAAIGRGPRALVGEIASFAGRIFWVQVAYLVFFRLDQTLVWLVLGKRDLGYYGPAAGIIERCLFPAVAIGTVVAPYFVAADDPARRSGLRAILERAVRAVTQLYVPAAVGLGVLSGDIMRIVFGAAYAPATPILRAFSAAIFVVAQASLLGAILDYLGMARTRALAFTLAAAVDLALNSLLIVRLGTLAPIVSLTVTVAPLTAFYLATLARRLEASLRAIAADFARALGASAVMGAALLLARPSKPGPLALVLLIALGAASYGAALVLLGGIRLPVWMRVRRRA